MKPSLKTRALAHRRGRNGPWDVTLRHGGEYHKLSFDGERLISVRSWPA